MLLVAVLLLSVALTTASGLELVVNISPNSPTIVTKKFLSNTTKSNGWEFGCTETIVFDGGLCSRLANPFCYYDSNKHKYFCDDPTFRGDIEDDIVVEGVEYWSSRIRYVMHLTSQHVEVKVFPSVNLLIHSFIEWVTEIILILFLVSLISSKTSKLM